MIDFLSAALNLIQFIFIFGIMIFLHELGHFVAAKLFKFEVEEFGFGYPPKIFKMFTWRGTDFTLNWIPFGGFVRVKGENDPEEVGSFASENPWKRLVFLISGSFMNILTGILLFSLVFAQVGAPNLEQVEILRVDEGSPAETAGLLAGDIILSINGNEITTMESASLVIYENLGQEIDIELLRDNETLSLSAIPRTPEDTPENEGAIGIVMTNPVETIGIIDAVPMGARMAYEQTKQLIMLPVLLIQGSVTTSEARFVGPVSIYNMFSEARDMDTQAQEEETQTGTGLNTLWLLAIVSVAIGLTNLLPIPALDGGRILFIIPEILFKKRVPAKYENIIHLLGFAFMLLLFVIITIQDVINPVGLPK